MLPLALKLNNPPPAETTNWGSSFLLLLLMLQIKYMKTMSEDLIRRSLISPAAIARTTSRRDMSCDIINDIIDETGKYKVVERASMVGKNVLCKDINSHLKGEEITKPLNFLHYCGICGRSLGSERDIYIYRGESAFCSNECREKQIRFDATKSSSS